MSRLFALADVNNFFVACEQVFQPDLRGEPVVVLSNNDGCVIARSPEAKSIGVGMGEPFFELQRRLRNGIVKIRSANFALYGDMSRRVMDTIAAHTPAMEIYSIDECFIDYTGVPFDMTAHMTGLRATVRQWTGLTISIGGGPTKTLAKLANRYAKANPGGIFMLTDPSVVKAVLKETPVDGLWGIGRRWSRRLERLGIETAHDFASTDRGWLRRIMGVAGLRTADELNGLCSHDVMPDGPEKRTLCVFRSFGVMVNDKPALAERLHFFAVRAAEKLRARRLRAGNLLVSIRGNRHRADLPQYSRSEIVALDPATSDTGAIAQAVRTGLDRIYKPGIPYKRAGVTLLNLQRDVGDPADLFAEPDSRRARLLRTMDTLNGKYGAGTLCYGHRPRSRTWFMNQRYRSRRYTTDWNELPIAR